MPPKRHVLSSFPHHHGIYQCICASDNERGGQWKNTGGLKQKHKNKPFGDASASHLSLVLWHV